MPTSTLTDLAQGAVAAQHAGAATLRDCWDCDTWDALAYAGGAFEALSTQLDAPAGCALDAILCLRAGIAADVDALVERLLRCLDRVEPRQRRTVDDWGTDALRGVWEDLGRNRPRPEEHLPGSFLLLVARDLAYAIYSQAFTLTNRLERHVESHTASRSWRMVAATLQPAMEQWSALRVREAAILIGIITPYVALSTLALLIGRHWAALVWDRQARVRAAEIGATRLGREGSEQ